MNRSAIRVAVPAGAVVGVLIAVSFYLLARSESRLPESTLTLLALAVPIAGGVLGAWLCVRWSRELLQNPATEGGLAGIIAAFVGAVIVAIATLLFPGPGTAGSAAAGIVVLGFAVPLGLAGLVAGDRIALRRWPELREIRKSQASAQAELVRTRGRLADLASLTYAAASVSAGTVGLRCPACGAENRRRTLLLDRTGSAAGEAEASAGQEGKWTGQKLRGLPMSGGVRRAGILAAVASLATGLWPVAFVLGLLFLPISPLLPVGQYFFGRRVPIYLTACAKCGGHIAFAGAGDFFVAASTAPKVAGEAPAAAPAEAAGAGTEEAGQAPGSRAPGVLWGDCDVN